MQKPDGRFVRVTNTNDGGYNMTPVDIKEALTAEEGGRAYMPDMPGISLKMMEKLVDIACFVFMNYEHKH
jgi:hypothetical protein